MRKIDEPAQAGDSEEFATSIARFAGSQSLI
jgi:hypothetical protein